MAAVSRIKPDIRKEIWSAVDIHCTCILQANNRSKNTTCVGFVEYNKAFDNFKHIGSYECPQTLDIDVNGLRVGLIIKQLYNWGYTAIASSTGSTGQMVSEISITACFLRSCHFDTCLYNCVPTNYRIEAYIGE